MESDLASKSAIRISVVVPTFNEADRIAATVGMIRRAGGDEMVVVDGGSSDGTARIAREAGTDTVLESDASRGGQLALGCNHASGEIILMLHADACLPPASLKQLRADAEAFLPNRPGDGFERPYWGCLTQRIDSDRRSMRIIELGNRLRARWLRLPMGDQGIFVHRETLQRIGGVDDVPLLEDVRLSRRLRRMSPPRILAVPITISDRRWRRDGVLRRTLGNWMILAAHRCGVSETRLASWYTRAK